MCANYTVECLPPSFHPSPSSPVLALLVKVLNVSELEDSITAINSEELVGDEFPKMSIEIPVMELICEFAPMIDDSVKIVSFLYYGVENLFPNR